MRAPFTLLLALVLWMAAPAARGAPPGTRVGILRFAGPGEVELRKEVTRGAHRRGHTVVGAKELEETAAKLGVDPRTPSGARAVASELTLGALVGGRVSRERGITKARVLVRSPKGTIAADESWSAKAGGEGLARVVGAELWERIDPALAPRPAPRRRPAKLASAAPPPPAAAPPVEAPAPEVVATQPAPAPPVATPSPPSGRPAALEIVVGPRFFSRHFSYASDPQGALRDYRTATFAPGLGLALAWFPFVKTSSAFARAGLWGTAERGLALESRTTDGRVYQSPHREAAAGAVLDLPVSITSTSLSLGYGRHSFSFVPWGDAKNEPARLPDVAYEYLRVGAAVRTRTSSPADVFASFSYRYVLSLGEIATAPWFPGMDAYGLDAALGGAYRLSPRWEVRLALDWRRYRHTAPPRPAGALETSGATDQYWTVSLGLGMRFGAGGAP